MFIGPRDDAPPAALMPAPLTPEQYAALPHDNAGPRVNAVVWSLTTISGLFLALRMYCKAWRSKGTWWDDWVLIAAWIAILIMSALTTVCVSLGAGKHTWDFPIENLSEMIRVYAVAGTFGICASIWSKTSFALTILRLTDGWLRKFVWFLIISMNVFMGVTALMNWIHCWPVHKLWDFSVEGTCWPDHIVVEYDIFSAAYSGVMDVVLAMIPWKLIWGLQMRKQEKIGVIVAMSMGIFAGITSFVKAAMMWKMTAGDIYEMNDLEYWSHAESTVTIIAASIPVLRVLLYDVKKSAASRGYYLSGAMDTNKKSRFQSNSGSTNASRKWNRANSTDVEDNDIHKLDSSGHIVRTTDYGFEFVETKG
ncbi:hypothetical protein QBC47DRAFT_451496 [Echria macrotheca]|uniref:Rhodopsin domain-containing protein n=1 Tax=Echria macrotheca TaxID=438768 RepID=A0AAJ0BGW9_9PEZI|nr:hypothetical protein QBC47DRAFT_451496 [Echria macrotheca]